MAGARACNAIFGQYEGDLVPDYSKRYRTHDGPDALKISYLPAGRVARTL
jgi:hypothetical protein